MTNVTTKTPAELAQLERELATRFQAIKDRSLSLDMTRGKPAPEQLDLSNDLLTTTAQSQYQSSEGIDCRNYGHIDGIAAAKAFFAAYMDVSPHEVLVGGNSSLTLMHDTVVQAILHGTLDSPRPWKDEPKVTFICPVPGYDRHFSICEHLGINMVTVEMNEDGPDMDAVEALVANDPACKAMWCVPKYSNPTGFTCSDRVVNRLAAMTTAAPDFRILWDNAYNVHTLSDETAPLKNILRACQAAGNANRVWMYGSTSKISFAGSGISVLACSEASLTNIKNHMSKQTIGADKINQLRHVAFFSDMNGVHEHMKKHAKILKPKFDACIQVLERNLAGKHIAQWTHPTGGYFISLNTMNGCAKEVIAMAAKVGVKLTPAGSTFPYKQDPRDRNIRLAPSFPSLHEIKAATEVVALAIELVSVRKMQIT